MTLEEIKKINIRKVKYNFSTDYFVDLFFAKRFTYDDIDCAYNTFDEAYDYDKYLERQNKVFEELKAKGKFKSQEQSGWFSYWLLTKDEFEYVAEVFKDYMSDE